MGKRFIKIEGMPNLNNNEDFIFFLEKLNEDNILWNIAQKFLKKIFINKFFIF
jgi:hypothetical protein